MGRPDNDRLASSGALSLLDAAEDPTLYHDQIMDVLKRPGVKSRLSTGIIGVLGKIGTPDDAYLIQPYLLN